MEPKVLAATLASLAAVFAGLNGGAFTADDIRQTELADSELTQQSGLESMIPDIPFVDRFTARPEPDTEIEAQIQIKDSSDLKLRKARLEASNLTEIQSSRMNIHSNEDIQFRGYTGRVQFENTSTIKGRSQGFTTSDVNITTPISFDTKFSTDKITVENTQRSEMKFKQASIGPTGDSDFGINTENTNLEINSFTGDITVYTQNKTLVLDGKVNKLVAGKYQLETED